jgi:ATP-binding cassette subfamily B protein
MIENVGGSASAIKARQSQLNVLADSMTTSPLVQLWNYISKDPVQRTRVLKASSFSFLNKIFDIAPEGLIGLAVDVVVRKESSFLASLGVTDVVHQLLVLGGLTLFIWASESLFEYLYSIEWRNLAQTIQHRLRIESYDHIQSLDMTFYENQSTGGLLTILNDDINQLERFLDGGVNEVIQVTTSVVVIGAIFFWLSPQVAAFALIPMPLILWGAFYFQKRLRPLYADVRSSVSVLGGALSNNVAGMATIKSYVTEKRESESIAALSSSYSEKNAAAIRTSSAFIPLIRMFILAGFVMTLIYGGYLTTTGALAVGSYSALVFLTQRLLWPLTRLAQTVDLYERAMASADRALSLLRTKATIVSGDKHLLLSIDREESKATTPSSHADIEFRNVSFSYGPGRTVLHKFNLTIRAGTSTAFVGTTGSGKTTLVKLLMRFYDPSQGSLCIGGTSIKEFSLSSLRQAIGFVSQDVFLLHGTVLENICYGTEGAGLDEAIAAAKIAEAHDFVLQLPQGYQTIVGERGQKLSGGQRQRISIARAVLKDPAILILDEATSAVDNETEAAIQRSIQKMIVGRTTIIIAHRLSTIRACDSICVLENGEIVERGTHDELLKLGKQYALLWRVQTGEAPR